MASRDVIGRTIIANRPICNSSNVRLGNYLAECPAEATHFDCSVGDGRRHVGIDQLTQAALSYAWPGALLLIGFLFLVHKQHGISAAAARAVRQHRILGLTIMFSGFLRAIEVFNRSSAFGILWSIALLAAAIQLITYREPEGAYESESGHQH